MGGFTFSPTHIAESIGFEPMHRITMTAFQTVALDHSANSPIAEGEGFEPPVRLHVLWFSRPAHLTALPTFQKNGLPCVRLELTFTLRRAALPAMLTNG